VNDFEITPNKKMPTANERTTQNQPPVIKVESTDDIEMLSQKGEN
jgi:hypothetical protein